MKRFVFACLIIFSCVPGAIALDPLYTQYGGVGTGVGVTFTLPDIRPSIIWELEVFGTGKFGGGLTFNFGHRVLIGFEALYYLDPKPDSNFVIPIKLRASLLRDDGDDGPNYMLSLVSGIKLIPLNLYKSDFLVNDLAIDAEASVGYSRKGFEADLEGYVSWMGGGQGSGDYYYYN